MFSVDSTVSYVLFACALAWLLSQSFKFAVNCYREQRLDWYLLFFGQGGMPSSHTAFVTTLALGLLATEGMSTVTLVASAYAIITIRDAMGVRKEVGHHAKALNKLAENKQGAVLPLDVHFEESVGHTLIEVLAGVMTGVASIVTMSLIML